MGAHAGVAGAADLDLAGGLLRVRVVGDGEGPANALARRAPFVAGAPATHDRRREPDLTVRFVDALDDGGGAPVGRRGGRARLRFPLLPSAELVCERRAREVPLLLPVLRALALAKGALPLHGAAFLLHGRGAVVVGGPGSGKTAALLAALADGGSLVAAELALVAPAGDRIVGVRQPVRLKPSHLARFPAIAPRLPGTDRGRLRLGQALAAVGGVGAPLARRLHADLVPDRLPEVGRAPFDAVVVLEAASVDGVAVERLSSGEGAERLAALLEDDLGGLRAAHACGGGPDPHVDGLADRADDLVRRHLAASPAVLLRCRVPADPAALRHALRHALADG